SGAALKAPATSSPALPVAAAQTVGPYLSQFEEGPQSGEHSHFAALGMVPAHRHFRDFVSKLLCDEEHFDVESETLEGLPGENLLYQIAPKKFEAALCVPDRKA